MNLKFLGSKIAVILGTISVTMVLWSAVAASDASSTEQAPVEATIQPPQQIIRRIVVVQKPAVTAPAAAPSSAPAAPQQQPSVQRSQPAAAPAPARAPAAPRARTRAS